MDLRGRRIGPYRIVERLAGGGMGVVYRAEQLSLGRAVALKVLHKTAGTTAAAIARFQQEVRLVAALNHPHIVTVYDGGEDDDVLYLAMELVEGPPLRDVINRRGKLTGHESIPVIHDVAAALAVAHARRIVHRDLKPENIMLTPMLGRAPAAKVLDFGIARALGGDAPHLTRAGHVVGTPAYVPPEAFAGDVVDGRADLYTLGVIWFEMLTGRTPFDTSGLPLARFQLTDTAPRASTLVAVDEGTDALIAHLLASEPGDRPRDAEALLAALDDIDGTINAADRKRAASTLTATLAGSSVGAPSDNTTTDDTRATAPNNAPSATLSAAPRVAPGVASGVAPRVASAVASSAASSLASGAASGAAPRVASGAEASDASGVAGDGVVNVLVEIEGRALEVVRDGGVVREILRVDRASSLTVKRAHIEAWRRIAALDDVRLPVLIGAALSGHRRMSIPFRHTPTIPLDRIIGARLALPLVTRIVADLAGALAALHGLGLVHGAISHASVGVTLDGVARVLLPPEMPGRSTAATDVYALGLVALALIAGTPQDPRTVDVNIRASSQMRALFSVMLAADARDRPAAAALVRTLTKELPANERPASHADVAASFR